MSKLESLDGDEYLPLGEHEQQATAGGIGTYFDDCDVGGRIRRDYVNDGIEV